MCICVFICDFGPGKTGTWSGSSSRTDVCSSNGCIRFLSGVKDFPPAYQELRMGLLIERYKLDLWASHVLSKNEQDRVKMSSRDWGLWKLFESIFNKILETFQEHNDIMDNCGEQTGRCDCVMQCISPTPLLFQRNKPRNVEKLARRNCL